MKLPMSDKNYSAAISQVVLAGTGIYCYSEVNPSVYARFSYMTIMSNSVLGLCKWGKLEELQSIDKLHELTKTTQDLFALPCIVSTVWIQYGYIKEIAFANILMSFIPLVSYILEDKAVSDDLKNTVATINIATLTVLSILHDNFPGLTSVVIYAFMHMELNKNKKSYFDMPPEQLYNYAMSLFAVMSLQTIDDV